MTKFFINYRDIKTGVNENKVTVEALDGLHALRKIGWPINPVWALIVYMTDAEIDSAIANAPTDKIMQADQWEKDYGPVNNPAHLWARISTTGNHRACNGKGSAEICVHTGHIRMGTIGEWYGNWTEPNAREESRMLKVVGSDGEFIVDYTGRIVNRLNAGADYDAIIGFDLTHTSVPYDLFEIGEVDICYIGNITETGYEDPATFEREGTGGIWETHGPRRVPYPA